MLKIYFLALLFSKFGQVNVVFKALWVFSSYSNFIVLFFDCSSNFILRNWHICNRLMVTVYQELSSLEVMLFCFRVSPEKQFSDYNFKQADPVFDLGMGYMQFPD